MAAVCKAYSHSFSTVLCQCYHFIALTTRNMGVHLSCSFCFLAESPCRQTLHEMNKTTHRRTFNPAYHTHLLLLLKTNPLPPTSQFPCSQPVLGSFTGVIQDLVLWTE